MISIFKRRQKISYQVHALQSVKNRIEYRLHLLADYLSKKTEHLSPRKLALLIIACCVLMAAGFCYVTIYSAKYKWFIEVQSIHAPDIKQLPKQDNEFLLKKIVHFHRYLDSLKTYDSSNYQVIVNQRPHLIDSLIEAEQILQFKN